MSELLLSFDPSGNWGKEGMGTTGWALFEDQKLIDFGSIAASDFDTQEEYWHRHGTIIRQHAPNMVLCESYKLQAGKAMAQSWSTLDTPQLIGFMRMFCYTTRTPMIFQDPYQKTRLADPQLEYMGYIQRKGKLYYCQGRLTNLHQRDAIRHGIYYYRYGGGKASGLSNNNQTAK